MISGSNATLRLLTVTGLGNCAAIKINEKVCKQTSTETTWGSHHTLKTVQSSQWLLISHFAGLRVLMALRMKDFLNTFIVEGLSF